jgi:hypothetical protein
MQFITWNDRKLYEYVDKIDQSGIYKQDRGQLMTNFLKWVDLFFYRLSHGTGTDSMEIGMVLHGFKYF